MHASRAARRGSPRSSRCGDEGDGMVDRRGLGQRLRGARRANAVDRVGGDEPVAAEPAIEAAPRRQHERDRARRQAGAVHLRRPAANVMRLRLAQRQGQRRRRSAAGDRRPRRTARACARRGDARPSGIRDGAMSASRGRPSSRAPDPSRRSDGASSSRTRRPRPGSRCRQQPRQRGARDFADAGEELGAHVGGVARRIGRREHEQAERAALALVVERDQRQRERLRRRVEPVAPPRSRC